MVSYNKKVEFCGKMRKFKRCPNKALKNHQKTIEDIQEKVTPLGKQLRDYQFEIDDKRNELNSLEEYINLVKNFDNASDEEVRESLKLVQNKIQLQRDIHTLVKEMDDFRLSNEEFYKTLEDDLRRSYGEFASVVFEDFSIDEIDEADDNDLTIAPRLSELYRFALSGASQKEVDEFYQQIIKDSFQ